MKIDLSKINKEILINCLKEENERDEWTRKTLARQIEDNQTYGKPEEFKKSLERYNRKKDYFDCLINVIHDVDKIEEIKEENIQFWKILIDNQIYISNSRIIDWSKDGIMYESCKKRNWEDFEEGCQKFLKIERDMIDCMKKVYLMITNKKYNAKNSLISN